jgi:simple sugar transport system permease protein
MSVDFVPVLLFLAATLRITVPYALAAMGGSLSERGGVVCLALEGIMLHGALAYVLGAWFLHDPWLALLCAVVAGVATAALHALVTVVFRADQITSGIGLNLLAAGLTRFVLVTVFHSSSNSPRVTGLPEIPLGALGNAPGLGPLLGTPLVPITFLLVPLTVALLFRTPFGLRLRATGELPAASASLGLSVTRLRVTGLLLCGALTGLAGAWLASEQHSFTDGMTGGRGYIAIAAMIVGKWHPAGAAAACLLFGATEAAQIALQGSGFPSPLLQALPYAVTMLALAGFIGRAVPPRALGTPYDPEQA